SSNREYIGEWSSNMSLLDIDGLFNSEFVQNSVLTVHLFVVALLLAMVGWGAYQGAGRLLGKEFSLSHRVLYLFAAVPFVAFVLPAAPPQLWIQENVVEENIRQFADAIFPENN